MLPEGDRRFRRHWRTLLAALLVSLAAIASFDFALDPFLAYRAVPLPGLVPYRGELESRIARGEILQHGGCEVAIVGTSRAQIALDPLHPAWNRPACNVAIAGASFAEVAAVVRRALQRPEVREIVWTLDYLSFDASAALHPEFTRSRFNPQLDRFEYHAGLLLGGNALRASWRVLRDYRADRRSRYTELGWMDPAIELREPEYRRRFVWALERDVMTLGRPERFRYDTGAASALAGVVAEARRRDVRVTLAILPSHALHFEMLARFGRWAEFERWKGDLVQALARESAEPLPVWDCTGYSSEASERVPPSGDAQTRMQWHWDSSHVTRSLGDAVIEQIHPGQPAGSSAATLPRPCRALDARSLAAALEEIRGEQARYRASVPAEQLELIDVARRNVQGTATAQNR